MKVGIVVGRFQVADLHAGHIALLTTASMECDKLVIFLGCSPGGPSTRDPLDYQTRATMVQGAFPNAVVLPKFDMASDRDWSEDLERMIYKLFPDFDEAILFGGRDSCLPHYTGHFTKKEVEQADLGSGTKARRELANITLNSTDFRHGAIHSAYRTRPHPLMAVDMGLVRGQQVNPMILLGRKGGETAWRFPGGMVDLTDSTLEGAARRELKEETGIFAEHVQYLDSFLINDWRYRANPTNKIMSALFLCREMTPGQEKAADDLKEVQWHRLDGPIIINPAHSALLTRVKKELNIQ